MFSTSVEAIKDYQLCARMYDYRHQDQLPEAIYARDLMSERYQNTLQQVVSFFFYKKQGGYIPSVNSLLNRWERLWFPKNITAYDISIEQHETWHRNESSYTTAATASILQFHEDFSKLNVDPLVIEEAYDVPIGKTIKLQGKFDYILRTKNKEYMVIHLSSKLKRPPMSALAFEFAAMRYAFNYRMGEAAPSVKYYMYDLGSAKPGFVEAKPLDSDVRALIYWAKELESTKLFVPRRGFSAYCRGCPFDKQCSEWNEWPK